MDRATEIGLIEEIIGLADQKSAYLVDTIAHSPISRYADPARFAEERDKIFKRKPTIAAHSSELEGPRAFLTKSFMGLPLLLTRDDDGQVQAFLNVCRHRGARLEREAKGCKRVFTCPYHAWSWTNSGALRSVPHEAQGFPDLPREDRGLRRLPCAEAHGFIWIIADPEAQSIEDIDTWLSGLEEDLTWIGMSDHRIAAMEDRVINANWKLLIEGGLEAYHFRVAHKDTIGPYFPDNLLTYTPFGPHMRAVLPRISMPDLRNIPQEDWSLRQDANMVLTMLTNTQLLVQQDHVMWFHFEPLSEGATHVRMATLVPRSAPQTEEMQARWDKNQRLTVTALMEDFELGEEIQAGFASRGNPSHLFGRFEGALDRFNLTVEAMLAA